MNQLKNKITISGFTFVRNAAILCYPFIESIRSILDVVDEFVIALASSSEGDTTLEKLLLLKSDKIRIIHTDWDIQSYTGGSEYARQTNIAKSHCTGDWLIYLQADEVMHENDTPLIRQACEQYHHNTAVEGFLCSYYHFWGDYDHYLPFHGWYAREIRIIRNLQTIQSVGDAQSFRSVTFDDGRITHKLQVIKLPVRIYHYGWVRHPALMENKNQAARENYHGKKGIRNEYFDYGAMSHIPTFKGTHPKYMREQITAFDWQDLLHFEKDHKPNRGPMKHEMKLYRIITIIEKILFGGVQKFGYSNWKIIGKFKG